MFTLLSGVYSEPLLHGFKASQINIPYYSGVGVPGIPPSTLTRPDLDRYDVVDILRIPTPPRVPHLGRGTFLLNPIPSFRSPWVGPSHLKSHRENFTHRPLFLLRLPVNTSDLVVRVLPLPHTSFQC